MSTRDKDGEPRTEVTLDPNHPLATTSHALSAGRFLAIYEIGRELLEQREPGQAIQKVHAAVVSQLHPDHACVLSVDSTGAYRPVFAHNLDLTGPQDQWPLSGSVVRRVLESGLSVLASDVRQDAQLGATESIQRFRIRSVLCVPLKRPPQGVIYLDNRHEHSFTKDDLEFLTALSLYTSLVLERTEEYVRAAEALKLSDERFELFQGELLRHKIVGRSSRLMSAYDTLRRFARSGARVLLRGETGTGKELFARAYATHSGRSGGPYVPVPVPALSPSLVESELFGHVRGAFTEATRDKKGRLELADRGVLFLDEVGDIEGSLQVKLLRFLDSGELYRVGDTEARRVDTRVVSATNRPLERDVEGGRFRADLLARLGHEVMIPPLRERPEDIPVLIDHFLSLYDRAPHRKTFAPETMEVLQRHAWPFNVRELQQIVERAVCLVDRDTVLPEDLPGYLLKDADPVTTGETPKPLKKIVEDAERGHILRTLAFTKGHRRRAIELLQVSPETFYKRLEEFGLSKKADEK